mmetsp:Transcript_13522/g.17018  ORF Transcript_13522/g.17018 Transcript_13522/m.17018 type:complete len:273 (-) Transcript_13522:172-990(-)
MGILRFDNFFKTWPLLIQPIKKKFSCLSKLALHLAFQTVQIISHVIERIPSFIQFVQVKGVVNSRLGKFQYFNQAFTGNLFIGTLIFRFDNFFKTGSLLIQLLSKEFRCLFKPALYLTFQSIHMSAHVIKRFLSFIQTVLIRRFFNSQFGEVQYLNQALTVNFINTFIRAFIRAFGWTFTFGINKRRRLFQLLLENVHHGAKLIQSTGIDTPFLRIGAILEHSISHLGKLRTHFIHHLGDSLHFLKAFVIHLEIVQELGNGINRHLDIFERI